MFPELVSTRKCNQKHAEDKLYVFRYCQWKPACELASKRKTFQRSLELV